MASPIVLNSIEQKNLPLGSSSNLKMDQFSTCQLSKPSGSLSNVSVKLDFFFIREGKKLRVKFIYSEKATMFCEISSVDLSYVVPVKSIVEISQNFVAFSEYMNFTVMLKVS